jgi:hypothetical protein
VDRPSLTDAYVERIAALCGWAGIDGARLAAEVSDHLAEASSRYRSLGIEAAEAERRAVEDFGDAEAIVAAVARDAKGGSMTQRGRFTAVLAIVGALAASAVLAGIQTEVDAAAQGTPLQSVVVAAGILLGVAALGLVALHVRRGVDSPRGRRVAAWAAATAALGVAAAGEGGLTIGSVHLNPTGPPYLATVAFLAFLVAWISRRMAFGEGAGLGLVLAGAVSLLLNGALVGLWRPLGAIGEGKANMGIELIMAGWLLMGAAWLAGPRGIRTRARAGRAMVWLGQRLTPTGSALPGAEPGANP